MCYGIVDPNRTSTELQGLDEYFRASADYILDLWHQERLSGIVLCGGYTNPETPELSEASSSVLRIIPYLSSHGIPHDDLIVCLEEQSFNTAQNIVFTGYLMTHRDPFTAEELIKAIKSDHAKAVKMKQIAEDWKKLSHNVVFICDKYRWLKVKVMLELAKELLPNDFKLSVKSFHRKDIHPNSSWLKQIVAARLYHSNPTEFFDDLKVNQH